MKRATIALALGAVVCGPAAGALATTTAPAPSGTSGTGTTGTASGTTSTAPSGTTDPSGTTTTTSSPAPAADSSATALGIDDAAAVGQTNAHADGTGGSATANAVSVGGNPLIAGKTGGQQNGDGATSGALLDTGQTPLGSLALTPWSAAVSHGTTGSHSSADAALAHGTLIDDKTLDVWVLHSHSDANYTSSESTSSSTSDGAYLNLGDGALTVYVLHSEANSGSKGSSTLASINGNDIGSSDQANGQCVIDASPLLKLTCLDATGGSGANGQLTSAADTATANLGNGQLTGVVTGTNATGEKTPTTTTTHVRGEKIPNTSGPASNAGASSLPFTGADIGLMTGFGAALAGLGAAVLRLGRRRRAQEA